MFCVFDLMFLEMQISNGFEESLTILKSHNASKCTLLRLLQLLPSLPLLPLDPVSPPFSVISASVRFTRSDMVSLAAWELELDLIEE